MTPITLPHALLQVAKQVGAIEGECLPQTTGKSPCAKRRCEHTYTHAPEATGAGNLYRAPGNKSRLRKEEQIHFQRPLHRRGQERVGSQGCAQQSPRTGQEELAGCLLQSDVLLELQGFFWVCFCLFVFLMQEGIIC